MSALAVDRESPLWLRLRSACQHAAWYLDLDDHADRVYRTIVARTGRYPRTTTGPGSASRTETRATGAQTGADPKWQP